MERFVANKFGLFNFWLYDEEEFQLSNGKIIFRGTNGSGKSVTTQSFIPLLLDGNKSPNRIDPFGSNARKIEDYLLVDKDEEDRISYLYMEFKKESTNTFITIGMGLRARRGKKLDSWYFILKDGRRINKDIKLYKFSGEKFPLTAKQFENVLGEGNFFTTSQREYMEKVNEHLFGYSDIDNYKALLNLLIQIRSPKLSKDFKPTVIYDILKSSLDVLSEDDLRAMAEAMDNMDSLNTRLEELNKSIVALNKIKKVFDKYNLSVFYDKARNYKFKLKEVSKLEENKNSLTGEIESNLKLLEDEKVKLQELVRYLDEAKIKEENLKNNEGFKIRNDITTEEENLKILENNINKKEKYFTEKNKRRLEKEEIIKGKEDEIYKYKKNFLELIDEEEFYREESFFSHIENLKGILESKDIYDFKDILSGIHEYEKLIRSVYTLIIEYENLNDELNKIEEQSHAQEKEVNHYEIGLKEAREYLTSIKGEYVEKINVYIENSKELKIDNNNITNIFRDINKIYEVNQCGEIINKVNEIEVDLRRPLLEKKASLNSNLNLINKSIEETKNEIDNLINSKEVVDTTEEILKVKKSLEKENIPFEEFYKLIDFKENIKECEKNLLEGNLFNMGVLNSIIIPSDFKEKVLSTLKEESYKVIFTDQDVEKDNISRYFNLEEGEFNNKYKNHVENVLKSISTSGVGINRSSVNIEKGFNIGIINGQASKGYISKFIGLESREKYRANKINQLKEDLTTLLNEKRDIETSIKYLEERIEVLLNEAKNFPSTRDIKEAISIIDENIKKLEKEQEKLDVLKEKSLLTKESIKNINVEIVSKSEYIKIPKNKNSYKNAMDAISSYRNTITAIKDAYKDILIEYKEIGNLKDNIEDITIDIDSLNIEIVTLKEEIYKKKDKINGLKKVLETFNLGEVEKEYKIVSEIIKNYPSRISDLKESNVREEEAIKYKKTELERLLISLKKQNNTLDVLKQIVESELKLNYIKDLDGLDLDSSVNLIIKNYEDSKTGNINVSNSLYECISSNTSFLTDYNIKAEEIFNNYIKSEEEDRNKLLTSAIRIDIRIKFNRRDINLYQLLSYLEDAMSQQSDLISDKEREVFEDILINTLSTKIHGKIYKAKVWVNEIDELMRKMDTSSGFKLYLKWKPKKAESEDEVDIKELVEILSTPQFMSYEDRNKLAIHFKERLKKQKRILNKDGSKRSYQSIIKDVLDYREWYEFQLYFSKPVKDKKELTDNEFLKLSGGEKAMAMYIPLFAAVNARYNGADKKDCPRIISLDEAFAGVDEDNISSMFRLIEGLNLDYVLNSQVLWGTYESVKDLSIYELVREGEDIVIPMKYHWNGKVKTMEMNL